MSLIQKQTVTKLTVPVGDDVFEGEIELTTEDEKKLNDLAKDYEAKSKAAEKSEQNLRAKLTEVGLVAKSGRRRGKAGGPTRASYIRKWAKRVGHEVDARGAIPGHVEEAYSQAAKDGELRDEERIPESKN